MRADNYLSNGIPWKSSGSIGGVVRQFLNNSAQSGDSNLPNRETVEVPGHWLGEDKLQQLLFWQGLV